MFGVQTKSTSKNILSRCYQIRERVCLQIISFASQRKMKEIGIRKVFDPNSPQLYLMMSKEFIFILLISAMIAFPSGYLVSHTTPGAYKYQM
jgi:putative ABC transport system permease protein